MHVALILSGSLVGVGCLLYIFHRLTEPKNVEENTGTLTGGPVPLPQTADPSSSECCGQHLVCEKDSLSPVFDEEIVYFDDEELDAYASFAEDDFTEDDIEIFREILLSLPSDEIAQWARSLQLRGVAIPQSIREELLMLMEEQRSEAVRHN